MTKYQVSTREFKEAVESGEEFLMAFEDGRVYYQSADSSAEDADYSMVVDPSLYDDVEIDREFMEGEIRDWQATLDEYGKEIELEVID